MIDNTSNTYISIKLNCGVTAMCCPRVIVNCPKVLKDLQNDLKDCLDVLPPAVRSLVRRTKIWVNASYSYGSIKSPKVLKHCTTHHHERWLICANDNPKKTHGIEIYDSCEYQLMRLHWNGCGLILHELCHLIHQLVLTNGLDNEKVKEAYSVAMSSGSYEQVLRRDWAGLQYDSDAAYATVNHKELFAEISVAYLSTGYTDLDTKVSGSMWICSPPFMAEAVVERLGGWSDIENDQKILKQTECNSVWEKLKNMVKGEKISGHCNKFFPFTKGQLKTYDPVLFSFFDEIWHEISCWDDPVQPNSCIAIPCLGIGQNNCTKNTRFNITESIHQNFVNNLSIEELSKNARENRPVTL